MEESVIPVIGPNEDDFSLAILFATELDADGSIERESALVVVELPVLMQLMRDLIDESE